MLKIVEERLEGISNKEEKKTNILAY
jgi:hypothetical protein